MKNAFPLLKISFSSSFALELFSSYTKGLYKDWEPCIKIISKYQLSFFCWMHGEWKYLPIHVPKYFIHWIQILAKWPPNIFKRLKNVLKNKSWYWGNAFTLVESITLAQNCEEYFSWCIPEYVLFCYFVCFAMPLFCNNMS